MLLLTTNEIVNVDDDKYEINRTENNMGIKYELSLKKLENKDKDTFICQFKLPGREVKNWQMKAIKIENIECKLMEI